MRSNLGRICMGIGFVVTKGRRTPKNPPRDKWGNKGGAEKSRESWQPNKFDFLKDIIDGDKVVNASFHRGTHQGESSGVNEKGKVWTRKKRTRRDHQPNVPKLVKTIITNSGPKLISELPKPVAATTQTTATYLNNTPALAPPQQQEKTIKQGQQSANNNDHGIKTMMNVKIVALNRLQMLDEEDKPPNPLHARLGYDTGTEGMVTNMEEEEDEIVNEDEEPVEMVDATPDF